MNKKIDVVLYAVLTVTLFYLVKFIIEPSETRSVIPNEMPVVEIPVKVTKHKSNHSKHGRRDTTIFAKNVKELKIKTDSLYEKWWDLTDGFPTYSDNTCAIQCLKFDLASHMLRLDGSRMDSED